MRWFWQREPQVVFAADKHYQVNEVVLTGAQLNQMLPRLSKANRAAVLMGATLTDAPVTSPEIIRAKLEEAKAAQAAAIIHRAVQG